MITGVKEWMSRHRKGLFLLITGALLLVSIVSLVLSTQTSGTVSPEQVSATKADLIDQRDQARQDLQDAHRQLLTDLGGVDIDRVDRDRAQARHLVLALASSSSATRSVPAEQASLDLRHDYLDGDSRVLTEFLPEWMATTEGTQYTLTDLDINVAGIQELTYNYSGVARLDPVGEQGKTQFIFVTLRTEQDGTISQVEAYRAAGSTRSDLLAADEGSADEPGDEQT